MYFEDECVDKKLFGRVFIPGGNYDSCRFTGCDFTSHDLSRSKFVGCEFHECNFSNVKLYDVVFNDVKFSQSKMIGMRFESCNQLILSLYFDDCKLNHSSFYGVDLKKTVFNTCDLSSVDFTKANIMNGRFADCDLSKAVFYYTNLSGCDFSTSYNYAVDPEENKVTKAVFDIPGVLGLLAKYDVIIK